MTFPEPLLYAGFTLYSRTLFSLFLKGLDGLTRLQTASSLQLTNELRSQLFAMDALATEKEPLALTGHPSWELAQRIVASPQFSKSERLSSFLLFVCRLSLLGQNQKINEQNIGQAVFGRKADYDTAADGIVRTHASRLRQRLEQYFDEYGQDETLLVEMPPGSYVPVFKPRARSEAAALPVSFGACVVEATVPATMSPAQADSQRPGRGSRTVWIAGIASFVGLAWMALSIGYLAAHPRIAAAIGAEWRGSRHPLWAQLFNKNTGTLVIAGDMALMNFEIQTDRSVLLGEYTRNNYVNQYMSQFALESFSPSSAIFLTRTMTAVDSQFIEKLFRLPGINLDRTTFRSAREIELPDLQSGNIVLLGNFRFNPWVQAFEPKMNFYFADSRSDLTNSVLMNRSVRGDEQPSYISTDVNHVHTEYSVVALQPNLNGSGNALLLEGQSPMSTEAAANFVENDADLLPFLDKIRRHDGSVPHFEVLLKVRGMSGNAASFDVLAYRVDD